MMTVNADSLDLIVEFEGVRLKAYPDPATNAEPWTIGVGHTSAAGPPKVFPGMTITKIQAYDILRADLKRVEAEVDKLVKVPINENQRGALVSLDYNIGVGNFSKSTLLKKLNSGDYAGAAAQFKVWNKAAGKVMAGLTRRRAAEAALFLTPVRQQTFDGGNNEGLTVENYETEISPSPKPNLLSSIIAFILSLFKRK